MASNLVLPRQIQILGSMIKFLVTTYYMKCNSKKDGKLPPSSIAISFDELFSVKVKTSATPWYHY